MLLLKAIENMRSNRVLPSRLSPSNAAAASAAAATIENDMDTNNNKKKADEQLSKLKGLATEKARAEETAQRVKEEARQSMAGEREKSLCFK